MQQISFFNDKAIDYAKEALVDLGYGDSIVIEAVVKENNTYEYNVWNYCILEGIRVKKIVKSFTLEQFMKLVIYGLKLNDYNVHSLKEVIGDDYFYFEADVEKKEKSNSIQKLSKVVK